MSLNSEPIKETNELLTMIDAGIAALREGSEELLLLDSDKVLPKPSNQK